MDSAACSNALVGLLLRRILASVREVRVGPGPVLDPLTTLGKGFAKSTEGRLRLS